MASTLSIGLIGSLDGNMQDFFKRLAVTCPKEWKRTMGGLGYAIRSEVLHAIKTSGASIGEHWKPLSKIQRNNLFGRYGKNGKGKRRRTSMALRPLVRLKGAMRYHVGQDGRSVEMGSLNRNLEDYFEAVQAGEFLKGKSNTQPVSPKMRRKFFAAGMPLKKGKTSIQLSERNLMIPLLNKYRYHMERYIVRRMNVHLSGDTESRTVTANKTGFVHVKGTLTR